VLSIGPDKVKEAMKKALAMGCDRGVSTSSTTMRSSRKEPFEIAAIIADFSAGTRTSNVIFTGMQSQDRGSAQVGVLVAEMLNRCQACQHNR
jgi:electron transfer flavoprotein beta subunit